uniref:CAP-Gly domain-containing protein n=1 Tax=Amphimedon queenslandica TaxID=400682 RepID=A0A1X7SXR7_AMPQE
MRAGVTLHVGLLDIAPLIGKELEYLLAVEPPSTRLQEYLKSEEVKKEKLDLIIGDVVMFKLKKPDAAPSIVKGVIRYIGPIQEKLGTHFGIEIQEQKYRGKGTSNGIPYFHCGYKDAVFVSMDMITRKAQYLVDEKPTPTKSVIMNEPTSIIAEPKPGAASGQSKVVYDKVKDFVKETVSAIDGNVAEEGEKYGTSAHNSVNSRFKEGDRVILQTVKEDIVAGTVRWVGFIRVSKDMMDPLPVVGIETDKKIDPIKDFDGVCLSITGSHSRLFKVPYNHSRVFLPEQLVLTVDEFTMQQQKELAAKSKKETKQYDATEEEKRLAKEFGMTVAEYRRQQQGYVNAVKQGKDDRKGPGDLKIGEGGNEERFAAGGGMMGGGGRGEGLIELTDTLQAVQFAGPEAVGKKRVEQEGRALEEIKSKQRQQQQENHKLQRGQHKDYQVIEGRIEESIAEDNMHMYHLMFHLMNRIIMEEEEEIRLEEMN